MTHDITARDSVHWTLLEQFVRLVVYDRKGRSYWPCYGYGGDIVAYSSHSVAMATLVPHLDLEIARHENLPA